MARAWPPRQEPLAGALCAACAPGRAAPSREHMLAHPRPPGAGPAGPGGLRSVAPAAARGLLEVAAAPRLTAAGDVSAAATPAVLTGAARRLHPAASRGRRCGAARGARRPSARPVSPERTWPREDCCPAPCLPSDSPSLCFCPPSPRQRCGLGERLVYLSPNVLLCSLRFLDVFVNSVFKHFIFQLFAVVR